MSSESIVGICKTYCLKYRSFQVEVAQAEYERLKAAYSQNSDTYSSISEYVDRAGKTHYSVRVKVPKERYFTEELFNEMYAGLPVTVDTSVMECDFISKDTHQPIRGISFSLIMVNK
jgi:hypothetical protein